MADALPDRIVFADFMPDVSHGREKAAEYGYNFAGLTDSVKKAFRGTVGTPGQADFAVVLDKAALHLADKKVNTGDVAFHDFSRIFYLKYACQGFKEHDWTSVLKAAESPPDRDKGTWQEQVLTMPQLLKLQEKFDGHDPSNLLVIHGNSQPVALQVMAQVLNFQGASHYLPRQRWVS